MESDHICSLSIEALDEQKLSRFHWRMVITAGMGFFTDAYDLFIIGVVTALLTSFWHLTATQIALLNGASLASAAFGAIIFGWFSDKFGRKKKYTVLSCLFYLLVLFFQQLQSRSAGF